MPDRRPTLRLLLVGAAFVALTGYSPAIGAGRTAFGCASGAVRTAAGNQPAVSDADKAATIARINRANAIALDTARRQATGPRPATADRHRAAGYVEAVRRSDSVERRDWYCRDHGSDRTRGAYELASHLRFGWLPFAADRSRAWLWYAVAEMEGSPPAARQRYDLETDMTAVERTEAGWMLEAWRKAPPSCDRETEAVKR